MNLLPEKLVYNSSGALQVALGAGVYKTDPKTRKTRVVAAPGKKLTDVTSDLIPIYDTMPFDLTYAAGPPAIITVARPQNKWIFFDGNPQMTWMDTAVAQTLQKNDNWNNLSGTTGNAVGNNDAYAAIGIYFEIHPYISFQFENWLLKILNPTLNIEVGQRRLPRFKTKLCHYKNYNPLKGLDSFADITAANATFPSVQRGLCDRDELPTQMWNVPLVLMPQDTIKIEIDFTNSPAAWVGNYVCNVPDMQAFRGVGAPVAAHPSGALVSISAGFFGLRGARVA